MCKIIGYEKISFSDKQTSELVCLYMIHTAEPFSKKNTAVGHKASTVSCSPEKFAELKIAELYEEEKAVEFFFRKGGKSVVGVQVY